MGRSYEERQAIVRQCVKIEKRGGDVLGYLVSKGYKYSPESTWRNMQKFDLKRYTFSSGKPRETGKAMRAEETAETKEPEMVTKTGRKKPVPKQDIEDLTRRMLGDYEETGILPTQWLTEFGYVAPSHKIAGIMKWLREKGKTDLLAWMEAVMKKDERVRIKANGEKYTKARVNGRELVMELIEKAEKDGKHPKIVLQEMGYRNPYQKMDSLKDWTRVYGEKELYERFLVACRLEHSKREKTGWQKAEEKRKRRTGK